MSITSDFKNWENDSNGTCKIIDKEGVQVATFKGEIEELLGRLYVFDGEKLFDIEIREGQYELVPHEGELPINRNMN